MLTEDTPIESLLVGSHYHTSQPMRPPSLSQSFWIVRSIESTTESIIAIGNLFHTAMIILRRVSYVTAEMGSRGSRDRQIYLLDRTIGDPKEMVHQHSLLYQRRFR
jgi:hypothetical protein